MLGPNLAERSPRLPLRKDELARILHSPYTVFSIDSLEVLLLACFLLLGGWVTYIADFAAWWWGEVLMVELGATGVTDGEVVCVHCVFSGLIEKTSTYARRSMDYFTTIIAYRAKPFW